MVDRSFVMILLTFLYKLRASCEPSMTLALISNARSLNPIALSLNAATVALNLPAFSDALLVIAVAVSFSKRALPRRTCMVVVFVGEGAVALDKVPRVFRATGAITDLILANALFLARDKNPLLEAGCGCGFDCSCKRA